MSKLVLCTVGTSVLDPSKYQTNEVDRKFMNLCKTIGDNQSVSTESVLSACDDSTIEMVIEVFVKLINQGEKRTSPFPAEIASLMKMMILEDDGHELKYGPLGDGDKVVLLFSDSPEGGLAALINGAIVAKAFFNEDPNLGKRENICTPNSDSSGTTLIVEGCTYALSSHVDLVRVVGLRILDNSTVRSGLENLVETIRHFSNKKFECYEKLINFTAGFKGITPFAFMTSVSEGFTAFFLHENGREAVYFPSNSKFKVDYNGLYDVIKATAAYGKDGQIVNQHNGPQLSKPSDAY